MSESCVHTPADGRGPRAVLLNGVEIAHCVYADTRRGKVRVLLERGGKLVFAKHRKRVRTRTLYGRVEVMEKTP
jgi:hypothetical protein